MKKLPTLKNFIFWLNSLTRTEYCAVAGIENPAIFGSNWEWVLWKRVKDYAKFVHRPVELGQFIPCNEKGHRIEKPEFSRLALISPATDTDTPIKEYKKALDKVLFKGWHFCETGNTDHNIVSMHDGKGPEMPEHKILIFKEEKRGIEDLINLGGDLVPSSVTMKQIGLPNIPKEFTEKQQNPPCEHTGTIIPGHPPHHPDWCSVCRENL